MKSFVSKGSETSYLNIRKHMSFEAELHVYCSKAIWNAINAIRVLLQTSFTVCQNATVCSSERQSQYRMESFVLKGFETRHLNITNHVSFETELSVDCSKVIYITIMSFLSLLRVLPCIFSVYKDITVCSSKRQSLYCMESFVLKALKQGILT